MQAKDTSCAREAYPKNYGGFNLFESYNNTIVNSKFYNNSYGVGLYHSDRNLFYHNSFVNNDRNVISNYDNPFSNVSSGYLSTNFWDDGYTSGGNYWSSYNGTDVKSGPYQNETGFDWIGDSPYVIDENNTRCLPVDQSLLCGNRGDRSGLSWPSDGIQRVAVKPDKSQLNRFGLTTTVHYSATVNQQPRSQPAGSD